MRVQRGSNIDSLLARKLEDDGSRLWDFGEQGREASVDGRRIREYFTAKGKPDNYQFSPSEEREAMNYFKAVDKSKGDWEGASSPFLQGASSYDETYKYKDPIQEVDYPKFLMESDSETLDDLATDKASERQSRIDNISASGPDIYRQKYTQNFGPGGIWDSEAKDDLAMDIASEKQSRVNKIMEGKEASMADFKGEEEGSGWDKFKGLFSSDSIGRDETLEQEAKDNAELGGKIGAVSKLYSLLQPETQQAAPTIPTARVTRGSIAFPGMKLASQKPRRKYFTPKGLMA